VHQGGILSPYLFGFYIRNIIDVITSVRRPIGYNVSGEMINLLCYADDIVLLSPSWLGLQMLTDKLHVFAADVNMAFSVSKNVCMVLTH